MAAPTTEMEQLAVNDNGNAGNKPAKAKTDKSKADKPKPGKLKRYITSKSGPDEQN